jgi:hypothetical protein
MEIQTHTPAATNKETWFPPSNASLPKSVIVRATIAISTNSGTIETHAEGNVTSFPAIIGAKVVFFA